MTKGDGKPCKKCGTSEWYKTGKCKVCERERVKKWYQANSEQARENTRNWRKANPDRARESVKRCHLAKPEKARERSRKWLKANPEKARERNREWKQANPDKVRESDRKWARDNPDKVRAKVHRRRTNKTQAGGSYTAAEWKALCKQYDNRCLACGKKRKLTADHVVPVTLGGASDISNIQPLCRQCNSSKGDRHATDYRTKPGIVRWIQNKLFD